MTARPMLRSTLVGALNAHRDNDVQVFVPFETSGHLRLPIDKVRYDAELDAIVIVTAACLDADDDTETS